MLLHGISKGWKKEACAILNRLILTMQTGREDRTLLLEAMKRLRERATEEASASMLSGLVSASPYLKDEAYKLSQSINSHLYRGHRYSDIVALLNTIHRAVPERWEYALDFADSLIQYGPDPSAAIPVANLVAGNCAARPGTEARICLVEVEMAGALAWFWSGGGNASDRLAPLPEPLPGKNPYALQRVLAKKELLRGAFLVIEGGKPRAAFNHALRIAPYDPYTAEIDSLLTGRFSLSNFIWRLNRNGMETYSREIYDALVKTLLEDEPGCVYFPAPDVARYSGDRIRSELPINEAYFLYHRCGESEAASKKLDLFIRSIRDSTLDANRDLLARAYYYKGLVVSDLGRSKEALAFMERGVKIYEELEEGLKHCWPGEATDAAAEYYGKEKARGMLYAGSIDYYFSHDAVKSAEFARRASKAAPDFDAVLVAEAIVQARNHEFHLAKEVLENMMPYPDRFYNFACLAGMMGDHEAAIEYLGKHFSEYVPPSRTKLESAYARQDPDLESLKNDPDFIRLVNAKDQ